MALVHDSGMTYDEPELDPDEPEEPGPDDFDDLDDLDDDDPLEIPLRPGAAD